MAYKPTVCTSYMGCSVRELSGLSSPSVKDLEDLKGRGVTLCVTSGQHTACDALTKAGYILIAEYKNYDSGHSGNTCKLWAAFGKRNEAVTILPRNDPKK